MDTVKFDKGNVRVIAHRGLSGIEKENTNAAFVAAANRSYYGIETDIWRTADGNFVLFHDRDLKGLAGVDLSAEGSTLKELREVILYDKDGGKGRFDLRVSTLEEYISICKRYDKRAVLELKSEFTDDEIARIIDTIQRMQYIDGTTFISFSYENLMKVRSILPDADAQFLCWDMNSDTVEKLSRDRIDIDILYKSLTEEGIKMLKANGIKINCWTVDNKEIAEQLVRAGVDFITTDILE